MKQSKLDIIKLAVSKASDLPNAIIEYNMELPEHSEVKEDSFFGVKAIFNKNIPPEKGVNVIYKY